MGSGSSSKKQKNRTQTPPRRRTTPPPVSILDSAFTAEAQSAPVSVVPTAQASQSANESPFRWKKGALLGRGAHGQVYECLNLDTGEIHVVKEVQLSGSMQQVQAEIAALKREIMTLKTLTHKNIVRYIHTQVSENRKGVEIIMEYVSGGSLRSVLDKYGRLEEGVVAKYLKQALEGVAYLHQNSIMHRDIKCANILVDQNGIIKLTDFGASKHISQSADFTESKSLTGSPYWMAPEVVRRSGHGFSSDIWSIGCVTIEMITGSPPWADKSRQAIAILRLLSETTVPPAFPLASPKCQSFLDLCLRLDPSRRATALELLRHPFITGLADTSEAVTMFGVKAVDSLQSVAMDSLEIAEPYDEVFDLEDIPMTGAYRNRPSVKPKTTPKPTAPTRQPPKPIPQQHSPPRKRPLEAFNKKPDDSIPVYDLAIQAKLDEKARRIDEDRRREVGGKRSLWQAELDLASRINYVDN